jgi:hypothetical protein
VKLPIQTVAVLFLTVTVYYIYSSMHPADKYAEAPMGRLAKQGVPVERQDTVKRKAPEISADREKKVAQEPGYKSLDMKYEYEKPAPPVPAAPRDNSTASAPAKRAELPMTAKDDRSLEKHATAPTAAAPSLMAEQAAPAAGAATTRDAGKKEQKTKILAAADKDADDTFEVTEYFVRKDLPEKMKVQGLQFSTRKISDDTPGLKWLQEMPAYRARPCSNRFLVDVEAVGSSFKYLYCYERAETRLIGIFEFADGAWSERK